MSFNSLDEFGLRRSFLNSSKLGQHKNVPKEGMPQGLVLQNWPRGALWVAVVPELILCRVPTGPAWTALRRHGRSGRGTGQGLVPPMSPTPLALPRCRLGQNTGLSRAPPSYLPRFLHVPSSWAEWRLHLCFEDGRQSQRT